MTQALCENAEHETLKSRPAYCKARMGNAQLGADLQEMQKIKGNKNYLTTEIYMLNFKRQTGSHTQWCNDEFQSARASCQALEVQGLMQEGERVWGTACSI